MTLPLVPLEIKGPPSSITAAVVQRLGLKLPKLAARVRIPTAAYYFFVFNIKINLVVLLLLLIK